MWRLVQRKSFSRRERLEEFLELPPGSIPALPFPLNLPLRLAEKIEKGNVNDPIFLQFVPTAREQESATGFQKDPVEDQTFRKSAKLLQKYTGRALLITTGACAMHCRYCFRQNYPYDITPEGFDEEIRAIASDTSLHEVILSGGDPLSLSDRTLSELLGRIDAVPHVKRIRFHTRFPIGIPERIDAGFLSILSGLRAQVWFVIHCNHPRELDSDVFAALKRIQRLGIPVLNQAVLLRNVNDRVEVLAELCESLADQGVFPYYLHQLDRVQGAAHFEVPEEEGKKLVDELSKRLSGYAIPKYVREVPGETRKTPLL